MNFKRRVLIFCVLFFLASCASVSYDRPQSRSEEDFEEIRSLHEQGQSEKTIVKGEEFLKRHSEAPYLTRAVLYYVAFNFEKLGRWEEAKGHYRTLIRSHPKSRWVRLAREGLKSLEEHEAEGDRS